MTVEEMLPYLKEHREELLKSLRNGKYKPIYWKQWKKVSARFSNLKKLGIDKYKAWEWANSRKGYWRISSSHILHMSLTNEYLVSVGYDDILQRYKVLHSSY